MSIVFYKIRKKGTDLYSTGGTSPHWDKVGKTWNTMGRVKCHLSGVVRQMAYRSQWDTLVGTNYQDAEVVTFEAQVVKTEDPAAIMQETKDKAAAKLRRQEVARQKAEEEREKQELQRLQAKYPLR